MAEQPNSLLPDHVPGFRTYHANIVGESFYSSAIARSQIGERIRLLHIIDNKHDPRAVAVVSERNELLGHLPRGGWLTRALLDEQFDYAARIAAIHPPDDERAHYAVVLKVYLR